MNKLIKSLTENLGNKIYNLPNLLKFSMGESPLTKFVILSIPRSGSNYLCGTLNSHPEILCHHEIFHEKAIYYALDRRNGELDLGTVETRDLNPKQFIDRLWQHNFQAAAVGFKLLSGQNPKAFDLVLKDKSIKKILLMRQNKIRTYVSLAIAKQTGIYSQLRDRERKNEVQSSVEIDIDSLRDHLKKTDDYYQRLIDRMEVSKQSFLKVIYEDIFSERSEETQKSILEFIGVSPKPEYLQVTHLKQNSKPLYELISNYEEIKSQLLGTELEENLYE
jgi:LPS sulfotransferase NodH